MDSTETYAILLTSTNGPQGTGNNVTVDARIYSDWSTSSTYGYDSDQYYKITDPTSAKSGELFHDGGWVADSVAPGLMPYGEGDPLFGGVQLHEGDYVLLKDQTDPKENGVYIVHAEGGNNTRWQRAGSFDTWGDFIGKIIFVAEGTYRGKNFESLAAPGGSLFMAENSTTNAGTSPLLFVEERPLLLFPNRLSSSVEVAGNFTVVTESGQTYISTPDKILDQCVIAEGNLIFNTNDNIVYRITNIEEDTRSYVEIQRTINPSTDKYIYVANGISYGHDVIVYKENA